MKIYLTSRYGRRLELCVYRKLLEDRGHEVTSTWLNGEHQISDGGTPIGETGEALIEGSEGDDGEATELAAILRQTFALEDLNDVCRSDLLIAFTEPPRSTASRGGRHVELGIAIGTSTPVIVVGYRENIFCWLPQVTFCESFEDAIHELAQR